MNFIHFKNVYCISIIHFSKISVKMGNMLILSNISVIFVDDDDLCRDFHDMKRAGCLYIWFITSSFCRAPNEWHETQAKIIHDLIVQQNLKWEGILRAFDWKLLSCHVRRWTLLWPGQVTQVKSGGQIVIVKCLEKVNPPKWLTWKWPFKKDKDVQI